jgi:hypothetical protein
MDDERTEGVGGEPAETEDVDPPADADLVTDPAALAAAEAELDRDPDPDAMTFEADPSAEPIAQTEPDSRYVVGDVDEDDADELATPEPGATPSRFVVGAVEFAEGAAPPKRNGEG